MLFIDVPYGFNNFSMVGMGTVRKIKPENVNPFLNQRNQCIVVIAGRANGSYNFRFIKIDLLHRLKNEVVFKLKRVRVEFLNVLYQRYQVQFLHKFMLTNIS